MVHTAVVLPQEMLDRLQNAAKTGVGVSAEIRKRLQRSYDLEGLDPHTTKLIEGVTKLAESLARDLHVQWYQTRFAREAIKAGFAVFLNKYDAEDDRPTDTPFSGYPDDAPPDVVGQTHARLILSAKADSIED